MSRITKEQWPRWAFMHRTMTLPEIVSREKYPYGVIRFALMKLGVYKSQGRGVKKGSKNANGTRNRKLSIEAEKTLCDEMRNRKWKTLQECATHYGITRERVRQIIRAAGVDGYELKLTADEKFERVDAARQAKEAKKNARLRNRYERALKIAEVWNDESLTLQQVADRIGMKVEGNQICNYASKIRRWFPGMLMNRNSVGAKSRYSK